MKIQIVLGLILIPFLKFPYANTSESYEVKKLWGETPLPTQNFEIRAFIIDIEQARSQLSSLNAEFKWEYEFSDYIYYPLDRDFDLNKEFVRLRVFQETHWDQKVVELSHKVKGGPGLQGSLKMKEEFNTVEEAETFLTGYRLAFSYERRGFEYVLDDVKIFLEDVHGLQPSVELVSPSKENINQILDNLAPVEILSDSIPKLMQNIIDIRK